MAWGCRWAEICALADDGRHESLHSIAALFHSSSLEGGTYFTQPPPTAPHTGKQRHCSIVVTSLSAGCLEGWCALMLPHSLHPLAAFCSSSHHQAEGAPYTPKRDASPRYAHHMHSRLIDSLVDGLHAGCMYVSQYVAREMLSRFFVWGCMSSWCLCVGFWGAYWFEPTCSEGMNRGR